MNLHKSISSPKATGLSSRVRAGFTIIELLMVIGILGILSTIILLVINPAQLIKQAADANRITELNQINKALLIYQSFRGEGSYMGDHNTIYISLPDTDPKCGSYYGQLAATTSPWNYHCSTPANYRKIDGTGWVPVDFTSVQSSIGSLFTNLPVDTINSATDGLYYTYINGSWALSAALTSDKYIAANAAVDGGKSDVRYEIGNNLALNSVVEVSPITVTGINPNLGPNTGSVSLTSITGTGFAAGASVKLTKQGQVDISCTGITVASPTLITGGSCNITGAIDGTWNVVVTNINATFNSLTNGFTVNRIYATGGTITYTDSSGLNPRSSPSYPGGYTVHTFTSSGAFSVGVGGNVDVLVVGGGGGGGTWVGGGGGAGGVIRQTGYAVTAQNYIVTVGNGAPRATANGPGANGYNSAFDSLIAIGGGGGGAYVTGIGNGLNGGSGGGVAWGTGTAGTGVAGQGFGGGQGNNDVHSSGGGGGAGAVGGSTPAGNHTGGVGGIGVSSSISGVSTYYGGGGGGWGLTATPAVGGLGGGGAASRGDDGGSYTLGGGQAIDGTPNTGGGGGGGWYQPYGYFGGGGGKGIVIIRYPTSESTIIPPGGGGGIVVDGGTVTYTDSSGLNPRSSPAYSGGYTVHTFTSSGNFSVTGSMSVDALIIAGGGGGGKSENTGGDGGGGGGAGGLRTLSSLALSSGNYSVVVGDGGAGATVTSSKGVNGSNSSFSTYTSIGGGGGGSDNHDINGINKGADGGSGGGAASFATGGAGESATLGGAGTAGQGYAGGGSNIGLSSRAGGGGGGAGGIGATATSQIAAAGGIGVASSISGSSVTYATGGPGGAGPMSNYAGAFGTNNRGNGGGGGAGTLGNGGDGGKGIVIIRYPTTVFPVCGNNTKELGEPCDGTDLNSQTCTTQLGVGYTGTLSCSAGCNSFVTSACVYNVTSSCGNNIKDTGEVCDGSALNSQTCTTYLGAGYTGTLSCNAGCSAYDTALCTGSSAGNTITESGGYRIFTFNTSGTFEFPGGGNVEALIVAGGGGGGRSEGTGGDGAGGGGAGGLRTLSSLALSSGNYSVVVGDGGAGATVTSSKGVNGSNSSFSTYTSIGGGGGGSDNHDINGINKGADGGSGGGAASFATGGAGESATLGGAGTAGQGYAGGGSNIGMASRGGGGGGGAGGVGTTATSQTGAAGGIGLASSISGSSVTYATGGPGGGGQGATYAGTNGTANLGNGGGGGAGDLGVGGNGGKGIVIVRYLISSVCGNNSKNVGEICDGSDVNSQTCTSYLGASYTGSLSCNNTCSSFVTSACQNTSATCGNNVKESGEICDGNALNGQTCASQLSVGYYGTLSCNAGCSDFNTSLCLHDGVAVCGNNIKEVGEVCDGTGLNNQTCETYLGANYTGDLLCNAGCSSFVTSSCTPPSPPPSATCGNGTKEVGEVCDGAALNGKSCETQLGAGYTGTLSCNVGCSDFNTSLCTYSGPVCGNGVKQPGEVCDGADLSGQSCASQLGIGYKGTLTCNGGCYNFVTSACVKQDPDGGGGGGGGGGIISATGGTVTESNGYRTHTFAGGDHGEFIVYSGTETVEVLIVGGGGMGGGAGGTPPTNGYGDATGGGGGGGRVRQELVSISSGTRQVKMALSSTLTANTIGRPSSFGNLIAIGGGRGANTDEMGWNGASGGGGQAGNYATSGGSSMIGGSSGGNGYYLLPEYGGGYSSTAYAGGGGGGAGGSGYAGSATKGGNGGIGAISTITGSPVYYGGGGGGGTKIYTDWNIDDPRAGLGGLGGGGKGGGFNPGFGATYYGGGGGGGGAGGAGGPGLVIIRYPI